MCLDHRKLSRKSTKQTTKHTKIHWPFEPCYTVINTGPLRQETQEA